MKNDDNIIDEFNRGLAVSLDPSNIGALSDGGSAMTTVSSFWLYQKCKVCTHTFRLGDKVYLDENGNVYHDIINLQCYKKYETKSENPEETEEFFKGLNNAWPLPENMNVARLKEGDKLVEMPTKGFKTRRTCSVCGHTFRVNDIVVKCPCYPDDPKCETAVHRDPINGLICLESFDIKKNCRMAGK